MAAGKHGHEHTHEHSHDHDHECSGADCGHESHSHSHDRDHEHGHSHAHASGSGSGEEHECGGADCTHESHSHSHDHSHAEVGEGGGSSSSSSSSSSGGSSSRALRSSGHPQWEGLLLGRVAGAPAAWLHAPRTTHAHTHAPPRPPHPHSLPHAHPPPRSLPAAACAPPRSATTTRSAASASASRETWTWTRCGEGGTEVGGSRWCYEGCKAGMRLRNGGRRRWGGGGRCGVGIMGARIWTRRGEGGGGGGGGARDVGICIGLPLGGHASRQACRPAGWFPAPARRSLPPMPLSACASPPARPPTPLPFLPRQVNYWLGGLMEVKSNDLYRMKGVLAIKDFPARFVFQVRRPPAAAPAPPPPPPQCCPLSYTAAVLPHRLHVEACCVGGARALGDRGPPSALCLSSVCRLHHCSHGLHARKHAAAARWCRRPAAASASPLPPSLLLRCSPPPHPPRACTCCLRACPTGSGRWVGGGQVLVTHPRSGLPQCRQPRSGQASSTALINRTLR